MRVSHFSRRPAAGGFSIERVFTDVRAELPAYIEVENFRNRHLSQGLLPRIYDSWNVRKNIADVNHITGDVHYLSYFLPKARTILTVHDTVLVEREQGLKRLILWLLWFWLPSRRCAWLTTISEESKRRILQLINFDPERIIVIPNPVSPEFQVRPEPRREGPFRILHIGTKKNKNLERLIVALSDLDVELTVIGQMNERQLDLLAEHSIVHRALNDLSDADLVDEYGRAEALSFISLDEGFGLPILEAQATGRPVVTSSRAPMKDVAGDGALLVNPMDINEIRNAIRLMASDASLRARLVAAGARNVRRFSRCKVAEAYAALYVQVDEEARGDA